MQLRRYRCYSALLKARLQHSLGAQVLEKVLQKSLVASGKGKPLTSYAIGEENDDDGGGGGGGVGGDARL